MDVLRNRKHKIEERSDNTSRSLDFSPSFRSPIPKHLRSDGISDIDEDHRTSAEIGNTSSSSSSSSSSNINRDIPVPPAASKDPTEDTGVPNLQTVLSKLDQMNLKMDSMATKEDLRNHMDETKLLISNTVDLLKDEISDFKDRTKAC